MKGAFTGATGSRGLFRMAHGGTLFLDEIGEISLTVQAKLLRALQEKEIRPVGASRAEAVDIRVVAATHRDLEEMVAEKRFRQDLFYRLNVVRVEIPPLRSRRRMRVVTIGAAMRMPRLRVGTSTRFQEGRSLIRSDFREPGRGSGCSFCSTVS